MLVVAFIVLVEVIVVDVVFYDVSRKVVIILHFLITQCQFYLVVVLLSCCRSLRGGIVDVIHWGWRAGSSYSYLPAIIAIADSISTIIKVYNLVTCSTFIYDALLLLLALDHVIV